MRKNQFKYLCLVLFLIGINVGFYTAACHADALPDNSTITSFMDEMEKLSATDPSGAVAQIQQYEKSYAGLDPLWLARLDCRQALIYSRKLKDDKKALAVLDNGMARAAKPAAYLMLVKMKFRIMSGTDKPAAIAFFKEQLPQFMKESAGGFYYFRDAFPYYAYIVRSGGKPQDISEVLLPVLTQHPELLSYARLSLPLVSSLLEQKGHEDEALSYAKAYWMICKFDTKSINEATAQLQKAWLQKDMNAGRGTAFLQAMQDAKATNPLSEVVLPEQNSKVLSVALANKSLSVHYRITLLLLQGDVGNAMLTARRFLLSDPTKNASEAVLEIARVFKSSDLNLVRANAYLQYFKSGKGVNPLDDFFKEHAAGASKVKNEVAQ